MKDDRDGWRPTVDWGTERERERERERVKERYWSGTINKRIFTQRCLVQPDPNYESKPHTHYSRKICKVMAKKRTSLSCAPCSLYLSPLFRFLSSGQFLLRKHLSCYKMSAIDRFPLSRSMGAQICIEWSGRVTIPPAHCSNWTVQRTALKTCHLIFELFETMIKEMMIFTRIIIILYITIIIRAWM